MWSQIVCSPVTGQMAAPPPSLQEMRPVSGHICMGVDLRKIDHLLSCLQGGLLPKGSPSAAFVTWSQMYLAIHLTRMNFFSPSTRSRILSCMLVSPSIWGHGPESSRALAEGRAKRAPPLRPPEAFRVSKKHARFNEDT